MVTLDVDFNLAVVNLPLSWRFRGVVSREIALIELHGSWGEFSPFLEYPDDESANWLSSALEAMRNADFPTYRDSIKVNGTIPVTNSLREIEDLVSRYPGCDVFKVKVGNDLESNLARLRLLRSIAPNARLRLDVNGVWNVDDALRNIEFILGDIGDIEYIEQPVADLDSLKRLKEQLRLDVKFAGDEIVRKAKDPFALELDDVIDILVLKVAPLGGINRSLAIAAHHQLPVVVSSALESAVGISHGLRLAAAIPNLDYASGLATGSLFASDLGSHVIDNGAITLSSAKPNLEVLERFAAPTERLEWWRERIKRCWEFLG